MKSNKGLSWLTAERRKTTPSATRRGSRSLGPPQVCSPGLGLVQQLAGDPDQHAVGKRRLEARFGELVEHFGDGEAVVLPQVIQQAQGMVLEKNKAGKSAFWWKVTCPQHTHTHNINVVG